MIAKTLQTATIARQDGTAGCGGNVEQVRYLYVPCAMSTTTTNTNNTTNIPVTCINSLDYKAYHAETWPIFLLYLVMYIVSFGRHGRVMLSGMDMTRTRSRCWQEAVIIRSRYNRLFQGRLRFAHPTSQHNIHKSDTALISFI